MKQLNTRLTEKRKESLSIQQLMDFYNGYKRTNISQSRLHRMEKIFAEVTAFSAIAAYETVHDIHSVRRAMENNPHKKKVDRLKEDIDRAAVDAMSDALMHQQNFFIRSVGSEGAKEILHSGSEAPSVQGEFGQPASYPLDKVSDAVEATVAAVHNKAGAISILAVNKKDGIMGTPEGHHYMEKLFAPPAAVGKMSIEMSARQNLEILQKALGIKPKDITVVILDRPVNQRHIKDATAFGATVKLITYGDLIPSIKAVASNEYPHVVMGRGGFEEGIMSAVAAKALGGFGEAKLWSHNPQILKQTTPWKLDDLVSGPQDHALVSASIITNDEWFDIPGIEKEKNGTHIVHTLLITKNGIKVTKKII